MHVCTHAYMYKCTTRVKFAHTHRQTEMFVRICMYACLLACMHALPSCRLSLHWGRGTGFPSGSHSWIPQAPQLPPAHACMYVCMHVSMWLHHVLALTAARMALPAICSHIHGHTRIYIYVYKCIYVRTYQVEVCADTYCCEDGRAFEPTEWFLLYENSNEERHLSVEVEVLLDKSMICTNHIHTYIHTYIHTPSYIHTYTYLHT